MNTFLMAGLKLGIFLSKVVQTCISLVRIILLSRPVPPLPPPRKRACSILGNGPSLNTSIEKHLSVMQETELVCVNRFSTSDYYEQLKPENYVMIDPLFFSEEGRTRDIIVSTFDALRAKTTWELNLYVPHKARHSAILKELLAQRPNIKPVYFNYTIFEGVDFIKHFVFEKGIAMPQCENVLVATLFLMINRNFDVIYLYGADHSWHEQLRIREDNVLTLKDVHFYDADATKVKEEVLYNSVSKEKSTMSRQFLSYSKAFRGYEVIKDYADSKKKNTKIYNASAKSYVDAFERVRFS